MKRHFCLATVFMICFAGITQCTETDENESFLEKILDIYTQLDIADRSH